MLWGLALAWLSLADACMTQVALRRGGEELNPLLAPWIGAHLALFAFLKFFVPLIAGSFLASRGRSGKMLCTWLLVVYLLVDSRTFWLLLRN
jgi:hypothetical protein